MLLAPLLLSCPAPVQDPVADLQAPMEAKPAWSKSISTFWIEPANEAGYLSAILYADRGPLHLEARWAYEDRDTGSLSVGRTIPFEGTLSGSVTPMIGLASGDSDGVVPAVSLELDWKKLTFSTDAEYLFGTTDETEDFFYSWSELSFAVNERLSVGLVGQRTNVFDQELTIDRGFLVGMNLGKTWLTAYYFNPELDDPYWMVAFGAGF
jgi:hypothetical protein